MSYGAEKVDASASSTGRTGLRIADYPDRAFAAKAQHLVSHSPSLGITSFALAVARAVARASREAESVESAIAADVRAGDREPQLHGATSDGEPPR